MSGHLCLKWNNHSLAFLESIVNIQTKERYCDATIACQGRYYPVHRIVLSTCSEYFEEVFERIQNPHPYIFFNDIEPGEMELLLNYMYQGETNVIQEQLPSLIKAAEALKIKGLAVSDDKLVTEASSGKRKSCSGGESPHSKRRMDENRKHETKVSGNPEGESHYDSRVESETSIKNIEQVIIKEEPVDSKEEDQLNNAALNDQMQQDVSSLHFMTEKKPTPDNLSGEQSPLWSNFGAGNELQNISHSEINTHEDMLSDDDVTGPSAGESSKYYENFDEHSSAASGTSSAASVLRVKSSSADGTPSVHAYQCPYCTYRSSCTSNVREHVMFKHTGERPFACPLCPKRFTSNKRRVTHMRSHTGEKPFQCHLCSKKFTRNDVLKAHLKKKKKCWRPS